VGLIPDQIFLEAKRFRALVYLFLIAIFNFGANFAVLGSDNTPPSPNKPWSPPGLNDYETALARGDYAEKNNGEGITIDPGKEYSLPELIDIAERSNPNTRTAWEQARQAAGAVGLSQSDYYPYLVASAAAGYERAFIPFPTLKTGPGPNDVSITGGGTLTSEAAAEGAALNMKWLLFDFGQRKATVTAAKEKLMAANIGFNAVHQQIVFNVTQHFYEFDTAREQVAVAESSLNAAKTVEDAAQARFDHGLATKPELLQADQQAAQAAYDLEAAQGELSDAQVALVESLGILPTTELHVMEIPDKPFSENFDDSLDELIDRALSQRPDLVAKLAGVREAEAGVKAARAEYYPKVSLSGNVGISQLDVTIKDSPYFGGNQPVYGIGLNIDVPIFDGFTRKNKLRIAESQLRAAESDLAGSRDAAVREVWKAYTDFKTALHKQDSATLLLSASQSSFDASLEAYRHGLDTYVDVVNAQRDLAAAHAVMVDTRSAIFTSQTALALSIGDLDKPSAANTTIYPQ